MNFRKIIHLLFYYVVPAFLLGSVLYQLSVGSDIYHLVVEYGGNAFLLVVFLLFIKPISVLFSKVSFFRTLLSYRREVGVLAFWFAVFHSVSLFYYLNLFSVQTFFELLQSSALFLTTGVLAFLGMFVLGITSNRLATLKLGKNWKKLQYIVYPTFAFICIHKAQAEGEYGSYVVLAVYTVLKLLQYLKMNKLLFWRQKTGKAL
ncbi:MAG: ferric reductase-like transmembrane domain-containing protein [Nanoarchaeota archaeon]|nr:ferric reductase-like transmembrane domain-containing protein [Nanoarchaeota archaeon]